MAMTKQKIVIDSSVIVKWLLSKNENHIEQSRTILANIREGKIDCLAPEIAKYEIGNAILNKDVTTIIAELAFVTFYMLPIKFVPETDKTALLTFKIAQKYGVTYYDASFMSLAKQENAILVTDNIKHQGKSANIKVISLRDY